MMNQERRWITDGRQSWIGGGINTAAITRLWQIYRLAHSEPSPSLRWSPSFTSIPSDSETLISMQTSAVSCLAQLSFSVHFNRFVQGYCRIISGVAVRKSSIRKEKISWIHAWCFGPRVGRMWGCANISITTWLNHPLIQFQAFWIRLISRIRGAGRKFNAASQV